MSIERRLIGETIHLKNGRELEIVAVGEYEPADHSVGIMSGGVDVDAVDPTDQTTKGYSICDNGDVYYDGEVIGHTVAPIPEYED